VRQYLRPSGSIVSHRFAAEPIEVVCSSRGWQRKHDGACLAPLWIRITRHTYIPLEVHATSTDLLPSPSLQALAVRAAVRADAMGLLPDRVNLSASRPEDSASMLTHVLASAHSVGIARALTVPAGSTDEERWEGFALKLLRALEESPLPRTEWVGLERVLGADLLTGLVGVSPSSLRRYAAGTRDTPDDVAARLHFLALVVGDLSGSYNDIGVRRWFGRRRTQLGGKAPADLLQGAWDPQDEGPEQVRRLAAAPLGTLRGTPV
jgi:hypothetical protein